MWKWNGIQEEGCTSEAQGLIIQKGLCKKGNISHL